jgi:hypothetical protein
MSLKIDSRMIGFWDSLSEDQKQYFRDNPEEWEKFENPSSALKELLRKEMIRRGLLKH